MLNAHRQFGSFPESTNLRASLYRLLTNTYIGSLRARHRRLAEGLNDATIDRQLDGSRAPIDTAERGGRGGARGVADRGDHQSPAGIATRHPHGGVLRRRGGFSLSGDRAHHQPLGQRGDFTAVPRPPSITARAARLPRAGSMPVSGGCVEQHGAVGLVGRDSNSPL
jgi:hypothetical protein